MTSTHIILTGFKKFGNANCNPTEDVIDSLSQQELKQFNIYKRICLDVTCVDVDTLFQSFQEEIFQIAKSDKIIFLHLGVGPNPIYFLEQNAYNNKNFSICDNLGYKPVNQVITKHYPLETKLTTKIPLNQLSVMLSQHNAVHISHNPGRYLCNYIYFKIMDIFGKNENISNIFIHFPTYQWTSLQQNRGFLKRLIQTIQKINN